ncbi:hypothetical protein AA313_de0209539 [Arthrobotrys entomopaga]|nr:hypothetical protein AA313_de0209539 [Arthrobotrys entomopaga]
MFESYPDRSFLQSFYLFSFTRRWVPPRLIYIAINQSISALCTYIHIYIYVCMFLSIQSLLNDIIRNAPTNSTPPPTFFLSTIITIFNPLSNASTTYPGYFLVSD